MLKDTSSDELMKAFDQVRSGTPYLSNDLAMQVALVRTGVRPNPLADLTPRELQTLSLLAEGKPYGRIAEELNVSYKTVVNSCSQLKQKLNAKNLPELIRLAVQLVAAEHNAPFLQCRIDAPQQCVAHAADARSRCVPNATLPDVPITNGRTLDLECPRVEAGKSGAVSCVGQAGVVAMSRGWWSGNGGFWKPLHWAR